jgi:hypothetical protein
MTYEEFINTFQEQIMIELAETGADRELDFDLESEMEERYVQYCKDSENTVELLKKMK